MKRIKNYISVDLAKRKVGRYKYWEIRDQDQGIIYRSDDVDKSFEELLDEIVESNADHEVSVKFGTSDGAARHRSLLFIKINEDVDYVDPPQREVVTIGGVPYPIDQNGKVDYKPPVSEVQQAEHIPLNGFREELQSQLGALQQQNEIDRKQSDFELQMKLEEQRMEFKSMLMDNEMKKLEERERNVLLSCSQSLLRPTDGFFIQLGKRDSCRSFWRTNWREVREVIYKKK